MLLHMILAVPLAVVTLPLFVLAVFTVAAVIALLILIFMVPTSALP
jgi:hypothetical protein